MVTEECPERRDDLTGLVAGWLTDDEAAEVRAHAVGCARCSVALAELESVVTTARRAFVTTLRPAEGPAPGFEERVLSRLAAERRSRAGARSGVEPAAVVARPVTVERAAVVERTGPAKRRDELEARSRPRHAAPRRSRWPVAVAAGGVLAAAAAAVVGVLVVRDDDDDLEGEPIELAVVPEGSDVDAELAPRGTATLIELRADGLDPEVVYELWLAPPQGGWEDRVPAGTFQPADDGSVEVRLWSAMPYDEALRVWATSEGEIAFDTKPPRQS